MVKVTLAGNEYKLKFTLNSMIKFEEETGKQIMEPGALDNMNMKELRVMLWACIKSDEKQLTLDEVGEMIELDQLTEITEALTQAFEVSTPESTSEGKLRP